MAKYGVVFANLGTPQAPTGEAVGNYLAEFLMDPYVIQIPKPLRWLLVRGIIVPFRKKKSAANYQKVWTDQGSPLLVETRKAAKALGEALGEEFQVEVAMRYGQPSLKQARERLEGCEKILFFPQYPQYAESTTRTAEESFQESFSDKNTETVAPYFNEPWFIDAYVGFLKEHLQKLDIDYLLMSFHGLPESHVLKTDPTGQHCLRPNCCEKAPEDVLKTCYKAQCWHTAQSLAKGLELRPESWGLSFQSRLGRQKWLEPSTEACLEELAQKGASRLAVICPGFSVDGLETLEEIAMEGRKTFLALGGKDFYFIPCLNDHHLWIQACAQRVRDWVDA